MREEPTDEEIKKMADGSTKEELVRMVIGLSHMVSGLQDELIELRQKILLSRVGN